MRKKIFPACLANLLIPGSGVSLDHIHFGESNQNVMGLWLCDNSYRMPPAS